MSTRTTPERIAGSDGRNAFAARLDTLFAAAGNPPVKTILRAANSRLRQGTKPITAQRISDWRRGHRTPATFESVLPVLEVLIAEARRRTAGNPPADTSLFDPARWKAEWRSARAEPIVIDTNREPYRAPASYRPEDADLFFGRDTANRQLRQLISDVEASGSMALVLLLGPQGVGKTSLLAAGLQAAPGSRVPIVMTPGPDPVAALRSALAGASGGRRLLIVEQGEELFTRCTNEALRQQFLGEVAMLAAPGADPPTTVVLAVDTAYLPQLPQYPLLMTTLRHRSMMLDPMSEHELREAIVRPAAIVGLRVEDSLVEVLLKDVGRLAPQHPARLSMLFSVLALIWENRRGRTLTLATYRDLGGVAGIMARRAERWWSRLSDGEREAGRRVLMALTIIGPTSAQRNRLPRKVLIAEAEDPDGAKSVIDRLLEVRILVQYNDDLELVDDLALTIWPRMAEWITEEREFAPARQRIEADAREWANQGRPAELLYVRTRLEDAAELTRRTDSLNKLAREFVTAALSQTGTHARRRKALLVAVAVLAVIALVASALMIAQGAAVSQQRKDAWLGEVIAQSQRMDVSSPGIAAQLALAAYRMNPRNASARIRLLTAQALPLETTSISAHGAPIQALAVGSAGKLAASAGDDGRIRLWDIASGRTVHPVGSGLDGHRGRVESVAFAPDDAQLVSAGEDGAIRLWDIHHPDAVRALGTVDNGTPVNAVVFLPGGHVVAAAGADGALCLLNIEVPQSIQRVGCPIPAHPGAIRSLATAPDAAVLADAGDDGAVRLWSVDDAEHPAPIGTPLDGQGAVQVVEFGPGGILATGTADGAIRIWDVRDPNEPRLIDTEHDRRVPISGLSFTHGGQLLSAADIDGNIELWNTQRRDRVTPVGWEIHGNAGSTRLIHFVGDIQGITAGSDGRIRLWSPPMIFVPILLDGSLATVGFDRDNRILATGMRDGQVTIWDVSAPQLSHVSSAFSAGPPSEAGVRVALRPDGRLLATTTGPDVRLWDLADPAGPTPLGSLPGAGIGAPIAFAPDGSRLVTGMGDRALQIWDVSVPSSPHALGPPLTAPARDIGVAAFDPKNSVVVAAGSDARIHLWDLSDGNRPSEVSLDAHGSTVRALTFAPDGRQLFSADTAGVIRSWDVTNHARPRELDSVHAHTSAVQTLAIDPSGHRLASGGDDQTARLWDISDPTDIRQADVPIYLPVAASVHLRFDPRDPSRILTVTDLASVLGYTDPDDVATHLCASAETHIDEQTWHDLFPSIPYVRPCP
ncbi:NACHT and WD repeat domain-containing protein [Nocardia arthritidis]|nr:NACHT and WD repeat domain-containing protein [Nocardia arthritidis]